MIALLLNHLWQSSLCVGGAGLIALALRRNGANVRFFVWFAASVKFLVPFAALTTLSAYALAPIVPAAFVPTSTLTGPLTQPFSATSIVPVTTKLTAPSIYPALPAFPAPLTHSALPPVHSVPSAPHALPSPYTSHLDLEWALLALWATGFSIVAIRWLVRWLRVRALLREAVEMRVDVPIAVKFSASRLEPGLVGILQPVILLPHGIEQQLSPAELHAVLAHELCHWRRRDNLLATVHMVVEALFWFFPLVWWLGARLNAERERACDESVLAQSNDPQIYAEGILKVCRAYLQSPVACVAGVSGASLKDRIEAIMENRLILRLNAPRKILLSASAATALTLPLAVGLTVAPVTQMQAKAAQVPSPAADAQRSIKRAFPLTPEISTAALPTNQAAQNVAAGQAPQKSEATTNANDAPLKPHLPRLLPMGNLVAPSSDVSQQLVASNVPAPASVQPPLQTSPTPAVALNDQPGVTNQGLNRAAETGTCALPSLVDTAELKPVPGSNLMTVPVEINGTPKQFLLDISARPTEISQPAVAQLGLPEYAKGSENISARGSNMQPAGGDLSALTNWGLGNVSIYDVRDEAGVGGMQSRVRVRSFTIGRATGQHLIFLVANDAEMGKSEPYDGLLTGNFFKQYDVELDFAGKQINYLTPTRCTDPDKVVFWPHSVVAVVPMTIADGKISIPVSVQGHQINAVIDTSSPHTVMRRDVAELIVGLKADALDMMPVGGLTDAKGQPVYAHTFSQISFAGGVVANNVPALILTNSMTHESNSAMVLGSWARSAEARIPDLTLGMDVLHQLHLYVVYGQENLYVTAAQQTALPAQAQQPLETAQTR